MDSLDRFLLAIGLIALAGVGFCTGHAIGKHPYKGADYHITLDHYNVILQDKEGNIKYFEYVDSIPEYIHRDNL